MHCARILSLALLLVGLAWSTPSATQAPPPTGGTALFEGARLITGDGSAPIENAAFLVENGKFTRVGKKGELQPPAGAARVDLTGKTVIPGLVDAHTHVGYEKYTNVIPVWARTDPLGRGMFNIGPHNFTRENILDFMYRFAYHGVAAAWSAGYDFGEAEFHVRDEILAGRHPNAARFLPSGPGLTTPEARLPDNYRGAAFGIVTEQDARYAVQQLAARKVEMLKLWNEKMSPAAYRAVIDEAHKHQMRVGVHPLALEDSKEMLRAGVDTFLHVVQADDEFLALVKQHRPFGVLASASARAIHYAPYLNPPDPLLRETIAPFQLLALQEKFRAVKPEDAEKQRAGWERTMGFVKRLRAAGLRLAMGADSGGMGREKPPGWTASVDLENMVATGVTPAEAIVAATKTSAELLGLPMLGGVAPGKEASFVVLDANPLDDITNVRKINRVFLRGQEVDRAGLRAAWAKSWGTTSSN